MRILTFFLAFTIFDSYAAEEKKLAVDRLALAISEDGTPVPAGYQFLPGEVVFFSCHVTGFTKTNKEEEDPKISLSYEIEAKDAKGVLLIPRETGKIVQTLAPEDKKWSPKIRHTIALPPLADPGEYLVSVGVKDELAKTEASGAVKLLIRGREVAPSDSLAVRNFRFLRSEEDKDPLQIAAYRPGDTVWARFDMTGYKLGPGNKFDVGYGLRVLRPGGDQTYEQPEAARDQGDSFYPQRYLPGVLSLNLPKDIAKGEYTIVLKLHDNLGGQTSESTEKFSVE